MGDSSDSSKKSPAGAGSSSRGIPISMLLCNDAEKPEMEKVEASSSQSKGRSRPRWRREEDLRLKELMESRKKLNWSELALQFPGKSGKQVRLRWVDHLSPDIDKRPWTAEEDATLLREHKKYGNSWSRIAKAIPGRSDAMTKNRYYQLTRRKEKSVRKGENEPEDARRGSN
ncbi:hypothetical protein NDN08_006301 [Rhodosorus marinus]|uniref:Uncharacterized protein n=1 Tax=Rhodosorus marinus TaxID=101924 RepID=A0AAV8UKQ5_9RHOD|nr:hypothetical protein NDN08_006301 [Rhodosorus marinus]